jgi:hypothetical protein
MVCGVALGEQSSGSEELQQSGGEKGRKSRKREEKN